MKVLNFDGTIYEARTGSATKPSISFAGDTNTGIYNSGADQLSIATGGVQRLVVDASGNVTIPGALTAGSLSGPSSFSLGSATSPSVYFGTDTNTGIYSPGEDQVAISTNSVGRLFVDASGRVGIGVSTPDVELHVEDDTGNAVVQIESSTTGFSAVFFGDTTDGDVGTIRYDHSDNSMRFITDTAERLRITSAGLVGIGTSSPVSALHIEAAAGSSQLSIGNTALAVNANDLVAGINFFIKDNNDATGATCGAVRAIASQAHTLAAKGTELAFYTTLDGTSTLSERVRIDDAGRVGIGTTSPGAPLSVNGNAIIGPESGTRLAVNLTENDKVELQIVDSTSTARALALTVGTAEAARIDSSGRLLVGTSSALTNIYVGAAATTPQIQLSGAGLPESSLSLLRTGATGATIFLNAGSSGNNVIDGSIAGRLVFNGYDGTNYRTSAQITAEVDGTPGANAMPGRIVLSTTADGASSPTERMRITSNGRAVFGGLTTTTGLTTSNILVGTSNSTTGAVGIEGYTTITTERFHASFANGNGVVGSISTNGSATAYNTSSDYRLKENITAVTDGITRLQQLKPSRFNFIADPDKTVDGFIAHEVQTIVPEAISGEKDAVDDDGNPIYQGIDQSKLVPLLTAALQEAIAKIESLEARLTAAGI